MATGGATPAEYSRTAAPEESSFFHSLARLVVRRPGRIVLAALLLAAVAAPLGGRVSDSLKPFGFDDPASESVLAEKELERAAGVDPNVGVVALVRTGEDVRASVPARRTVERVAAELARDPALARAATFYETGNPALVSRDGRATYVAGFFKPLSDDEQTDAARRLRARLDSEPGVVLGGGGIAFEEVDDIVARDLTRAELIAFPLLLVLAFSVFRGLVAALLPPLVGGLTIVLVFLALRVASEAVDLSIFALNLVTGMGLGLAIDWSLLMVSRYREELARAPSADAVRTTIVTAGRTVLFSALTVAAAMAALTVFPQRFLYSMGLGGVLASLIGGAVALLVLPAALALLGPRVNALAPRRWQRRAEAARPASSGAWYRLSAFVMRHPGRIAAASALLLVALGSPFLRIEFTAADARVLPESSRARQVDRALRSEFPPNRTDPIYVAVDSSAAPESLARRLRALPGTAVVAPPLHLGPHTWRLDVIPRADPLSAESRRLVGEVRALAGRLGGRAGGETASFVDQRASLGAHLPLAFGIVAAGTLLVLFLMTGSVVLPLKALAMNVLTLSAAFGVLVLVFQDGRLEGPLGYTSPGALDFTQPILLFAVVFALSTDYGVFLLSRIKETWDEGASNAESVALGLERTGRIVTAAALLFCVAIGVFSTSRIVFIKELGVGIAVAVIVDATIVRALLVPSLMKLLGAWNWWAPGPLRRLHERLGLAHEAR